MIVVPTGFPDIVSLQIPVQTGSRNEVEPGKTGFAHFFEHMMFRGTRTYSPERYQEVLTRIGARQNAYTTDDYTNYHITFSRDDLEQVLAMEADRFQNLEYSDEAFRTEASAVLGEYNKNSADPTEKLFEALRDAAYTTHTYKHTTMGFLRDIEDMPEQFAYSRTFFDRWYRPEYATLIVAGDVTPESVLPLAEKHWGAWRRGTFTLEIPAEPAPRGPVYTHVAWETPTLPWVWVAFHGPAFSATDRAWAATDLLVDLWFGETSDLYRELVEQSQLVDVLFAHAPATQDPGLIVVGARAKELADAVRVRDAILRTARGARDEMIPAARVEDAKSHARYALIAELDNTEAIADALARYVRYDRTAATLDELLNTYRAVTPDDVRAAAERWLTANGLVVATLSHEPIPAGFDEGLARALDEVSVAMAAMNLDPLVQHSGLPELDLKILFRTGSVHDPAGKEGLAALTAAMIAEAGSRTRRFDEITRALFPLAATFTAQVDKEMTTFTGRVHRDEWETFADVVFPMLLEPGFREEDFTRVRDAQLGALVQDLRSDNDEELGKERLQDVVFRGTRWAHPVLGTVSGIRAITLDDVRRFAAERYVRANVSVGLSGDLPDGVVPRVERALGQLPEGKLALEPDGRVERHRGIRVDIVEKDTRAVAISLGFPIDVLRGHPDFPALWLARAWLGEHRSSVSHLYQRIREVRGMNYGDYAYLEAFPGAMYRFTPLPNRARHRQLFELWLRPVLPQNAAMALRIALYELQTLIERGLTEEDFERTRSYLMKSVPQLTATQDDRLGYALDSRWFGITDFTAYIRESLRAITRQAVNDALVRHLTARDLQVVMVARDAESLRDELVSGTYTPITYDAPKPPELIEEDRRIATIPLGIRADDVTITRVAEVFE